MKIRSALVFVDWDSARRIGNVGKIRNVRRPMREVEDAIAALQDEVAKLLHDKEVYRVSWRIYHGWHNGTTPTQDRKDFEGFVNSYESRRLEKISFGRDFKYGDEILCQSSRSPLRYTLRNQPRGQGQDDRPVQKMVDTALVSDLLHAARSRDHDRLIVIGDDDDLLPGLFVAEKWGAPVHLLRLNNTSSLPLMPGRDKGFPMTRMQRRER